MPPGAMFIGQARRGRENISIDARSFGREHHFDGEEKMSRKDEKESKLL